MTLSVCLIVRDEEQVIGRCLNCVSKFADEIVVVDTGSSDNTVEQARKFTKNIFFFDWCDDFSAARNFSLEQASGDYVMWIDADDVVEDDDCEKIKKLVCGGKFDMAFLPYAAAFDNGEPTFVYYRERIFRRALGCRFEGAVHEAVVPRGKVVYGDALICHKKVKSGDGLRNLHILQKQIARGICLDERSLFYYGRELLYNNMFYESAAVFEKFLKGGGWVENKIEACINLYQVYTAVGDDEKAEAALLKSFTFAPPRSQVCCIMGEKFLQKNDEKSAIYWYQSAINAKSDAREGGFLNLDYSGFIPYMQLCVIYDRLGDTERANEYNEAAGAIKPHNKNYLYNKQYFLTKSGKGV